MSIPIEPTYNHRLVKYVSGPIALISEPLAEFIDLGEFPAPWLDGIPPGVRRAGPEVGNAEDLIDRTWRHAEHEVAFDLDRSAGADEACAELILQPGVDAFGHGSKITSSGSGMWMSFLRSTSLAHSALAHCCWARKLRSMIGAWPSSVAVLVDGDGVVGRIHQIVRIGDPGAGHGHQRNGDLTVVDGSRGQHAGNRDLAAGDIQMQFITDPGFFIALAVFIGADVARGGQLGEHLIEFLHGLVFEPRWFGLWPLLVLARRPRASDGGGCPPSERSISASCILAGRSHCANSAKAREKVASDGTCERRSQPRMQRNDLSTARRSIRALVVGTPSIALVARARRSSGGRPGRGGRHKGFEADHVEGGDEATERFDFLAQGNRDPWMWFQRAFIASRGRRNILESDT